MDADFCTKFKIQDQIVNCLVDTGAECSLLTKKIANYLNCHFEPALITLKGLGNSTIFANTKTSLKIERDGMAFEICFYIVDDSAIVFDAILGRDLFLHKGLEIILINMASEFF